MIVVGDRLADVRAARSAGAIGVLVPSRATEPEATEASDHNLPSIGEFGALIDRYLEDSE